MVLPTVAIIGGAVMTWLYGLGIAGFVLIIVGLIGIILAIGTPYFIKWLEKRSTKYIPSLLIEMDNKMKQLIESSKCSIDEAKQIQSDLFEILGIDEKQIQRRAKNIISARQMINEQVNNEPNLILEQLRTKIYENLIYTKYILSEHKIDLNSIKDNEYRYLETQLTKLKSRIVGGSTRKIVRAYEDWWQLLGNYHLYVHYTIGESIPLEFSPAVSKKAKAIFDMRSEQIENIISNLLDDVQDAVQQDKKR